MHQEQRKKAAEYFSSHGIERALIASPASVKWLTGFAAPIEVGPNPFQGGPPIVWYEAGIFTLVVVEGLAAAAAAFAALPGCRIVTYEGYTIQAPITGHLHLAAALGALVGAHRENPAVEMRDVPYYLGALLTGSADLVAIDGWAEPLRAIKTEEELQKLRETFRLTDVGHAAARGAVQAGATEMDVYLAAHAAIHRAAGERVPIGNDFVVGSRENNIGGWPLYHKIKPGDSVIVDISTIRYGYWSDSCATYYAGEASAKQKAMHDLVSRALDTGIAMLRPGVLARDVDRAMRHVITDAGYPDFPHHGGHGVGVTGHEAPRIVPYNEEVLEEGMVVMLEPGIYFPGETSVRLEEGLLITHEGVEQLTKHETKFVKSR